MIEAKKTSSLIEQLRTFCTETSLHGWAYLASEERLSFLAGVKKALWTVIVIGAITCACYFVTLRAIEFSRSYVTVSTETRTASLSEVFFPSLVVCNVSPLRKSFMYDILADSPEFQDGDNLTQIWNAIMFEFIDGWPTPDRPNEKDKQLIDYFLSRPRLSSLIDEFLQKEVINTTYWNYSNYSQVLFKHSLVEERGTIIANKETHGVKAKLIRFLASQYSRNDTVLDMDWLGSELGLYFSKGFGTDFGMCDWITPNSSTSKLREIGPGSQTGLNNGLTLLLDAETFDYGTATKIAGFKLALVHHLDMPLMSQSGINIAPGSDVQISVSPTILTTSEQAIERFSPEERQCYAEDEITLDHLPNTTYRYQMSNCLFETLVQDTFTQCKCSPIALGFNISSTSCHGRSINCNKRVFNNLGMNRKMYSSTLRKTVECYAACKTQTHSIIVTNANYPSQATFKYTKEFCFIVRHLLSSYDSRARVLKNEFPNLSEQISILKKTRNVEEFCPQPTYKWVKGKAFDSKVDQKEFEDDVYEYAKANVASITVFIRDPFAEKILTSEKISKLSFMSDVGGLLGLFMGFSFVSAVEILYHALKILASSFYVSAAQPQPDKKKNAANSTLVKEFYQRERGY